MIICKIKKCSTCLFLSFIAAAFTVKIGSLGIAFGCYHASRSLHSKILHKIVRAPMMFFDTTPLGRIMNRCSKDMDYADGNIPLIMRSWFNMIVPLLSTMILITYSTPVFLAAGIPLIVVFVLSQVRVFTIILNLQHPNVPGSWHTYHCGICVITGKSIHNNIKPTGPQCS